MILTAIAPSFEILDYQEEIADFFQIFYIGTIK